MNEAKRKPRAIFAIFTPYESALVADDRSDFFSISQGTLPIQCQLMQAKYIALPASLQSGLKIGQNYLPLHLYSVVPKTNGLSLCHCVY